MNTYRFSILTPDKKCFEDTVASIIVSGENGQFTILAQHTPMVALLVEGPISIRTNTQTRMGQVGSGILQVGREETVALVHSFHWDGEEGEGAIAVEPDRGEDSLL